METDEDRSVVHTSVCPPARYGTGADLYPLVCVVQAICKGGQCSWTKEHACFHCWRMKCSEQWASLGSCVWLTISKYGTAYNRGSHWKEVSWSCNFICRAATSDQVNWWSLVENYEFWLTEHTQVGLQSSTRRSWETSLSTFNLWERCLQHLTKLCNWLAIWNLKWQPNWPEVFQAVLASTKVTLAGVTNCFSLRRLEFLSRISYKRGFCMVFFPMKTILCQFHQCCCMEATPSLYNNVPFMFPWWTTSPVARKCIVKVLNQKVAKLCDSFTIIFTQNSSILRWAVHQPIAFSQLWSLTRRSELATEELFAMPFSPLVCIAQVT